MAKQRNSLGILVLPCNTGGERISWDAYKEKYGLDLDKIFAIRNLGTTEDPNLMPRFRKGFSKIVAISLEQDALPGVTFPDYEQVHETGTDNFYLKLKCYEQGMEFGYELSIFADKTVIGGKI